MISGLRLNRLQTDYISPEAPCRVPQRSTVTVPTPGLFKWRRCGVGEPVGGSDPTEGLWARSEAAELLPGAILTLHPAQRRSPRDSNQSVFFMIRLRLLRARTAGPYPRAGYRHRALGRLASGPREP